MQKHTCTLLRVLCVVPASSVTTPFFSRALGYICLYLLTSYKAVFPMLTSILPAKSHL